MTPGLNSYHHSQWFDPHSSAYRQRTVLFLVVGREKVIMKNGCLVRWARRAGTRDFCSAFTALVGPVENIFFLAVHYFNYFVHIAQQAGRAGSHAGSPVS
jgi:hypothetical protein